MFDDDTRTRSALVLTLLALPAPSASQKVRSTHRPADDRKERIHWIVDGTIGIKSLTVSVRRRRVADGGTSPEEVAVLKVPASAIAAKADVAISNTLEAWSRRDCGERGLHSIGSRASPRLSYALKTVFSRTIPTDISSLRGTARHNTVNNDENTWLPPSRRPGARRRGARGRPVRAPETWEEFWPDVSRRVFRWQVESSFREQRRFGGGRACLARVAIACVVSGLELTASARIAALTPATPTAPADFRAAFDTTAWPVPARVGAKGDRFYNLKERLSPRLRVLPRRPVLHGGIRMPIRPQAVRARRLPTIWERATARRRACNRG
jgi:hypothetical protein